MKNEDCLFCKIVVGDVPSHVVGEDDAHLAFLTIFPNTEGMTVVIPKDHHGSYFKEVPEEVIMNLMKFVRGVAGQIDRAFDDVGRTGLIFEGFGVDHLHAKLIPMHGTTGDWKQRLAPTKQYFETYQGYLSSNDSERADDKALAALAERIRNAS